MSLLEVLNLKQISNRWVYPRNQTEIVPANSGKISLFLESYSRIGLESAVSEPHSLSAVFANVTFFERLRHQFSFEPHHRAPKVMSER